MLRPLSKHPTLFQRPAREEENLGEGDLGADEIRVVEDGRVPREVEEGEEFISQGYIPILELAPVHLSRENDATQVSIVPILNLIPEDHCVLCECGMQTY